LTLPHPAWAGLPLALAALAAVAARHRPAPRRASGRTLRGAATASRPSPSDPGSAGWANRRQLAPLVVRGAPPGRLVLGTLAVRAAKQGRTVLACETAQSVAVIGPTQSGKTTALAVPAILGWEGPVLAASVKTDLVLDTLAWRRSRGRVWCFDPGGATGLPASRWSPLPSCSTWSGARRVASDLTEVTRGPGTTADGEFWYATAAKLLAPLLFAAAHAGLEMGDVIRWVDTQEVAEVAGILEATGVPEALQAARATWQRDDRQRSSVYTTAETVLEPFADGEFLTAHLDPADTPPFGTPAVPSASSFCGPHRTRAEDVGDLNANPADVDPAALLLGSNTLYLCAPAHDQRRLRAVFCALVKRVLEAAFERSAHIGGPIDPPLLVVLDEAANIAPLSELDGLAATCAGHGVQLVTVWQDLSQITARYGERGATVVNNHRAKIFLSGTSDPRTLDHASHLVGEEELLVPSVTRDPNGARTVTTSPVRRALLAPEALRRMAPTTGVLVYGSLPPARLCLRPWFDDPLLAGRGGAAPPRRARVRPFDRA
jgi:type IV secretion system protein VirD4